MKKITSLLVLAVVLSACGGNEVAVEDVVASKDLEAIRTKRTELTTALKSLIIECQCVVMNLFGFHHCVDRYLLIITLEGDIYICIRRQ